MISKLPTELPNEEQPMNITRTQIADIFATDARIHFIDVYPDGFVPTDARHPVIRNKFRYKRTSIAAQEIHYDARRPFDTKWPFWCAVDRSGNTLLSE